MLLSRGFADADITLLEDDAATRERILAEAAALARTADDELGILYLVANGSRADGRPSVVPYDGRGGGAADIVLAELPVATARNLVTIVDAGCGHTTAKKGARTAQAVSGPSTPSFRGLVFEVDVDVEDELPADVAGVLLLAAIGTARGEPPAARERGTRSTRRGLLTETLLTALDAGGGEVTYAGWRAAAASGLPFEVIGHGAALDRVALGHHVRVGELERRLDELECASAAVAADLAQRETARRGERNEACPAVWLELGLAQAAAGRPAEAIRHLRTASNLYDDEAVRTAEGRRDPRAEILRREAHYHLGRLLHEHATTAGDHADGVASLRHARDLTQDDPRVLLHLGLAIREQAERQTLVEAKDLLRAYVDAGAPLGRLSEIDAFLAGGR